jgi:hypothetical protein
MARRRRRRSASRSLTLADIQKALRSHRTDYSGLAAKVDSIGRMIAETEAELVRVSGDGAARMGRRAGRGIGRVARIAAPVAGRRRKAKGAGRRAKGQDLATFLTKVLSSSRKPMGIAEITAGVKKAGYVSSSASLPKIVGMRLGTNRAFKRAGRGLYQLAK